LVSIGCSGADEGGGRDLSALLTMQRFSVAGPFFLNEKYINNFSEKITWLLFKGMGLVRLLLISALAATLIGCSSASQQTRQSFADSGLYQAYQQQSSQMYSKRRVLPGRTVTANSRHRKNNDPTKIAKSHVVSSFIRLHDRSNIGITTPPIAAKTETPSSPQLHDESVTTPTIAAKTETPPSSQLDDESVIKKAKATIAAKMNYPDSVEFEDMKRAARKNALGNSIDTICGFVRDKNSGPKPFIYLVQKDEAYIGGYTIATSEYRNICSITTLPGSR